MNIQNLNLVDFSFEQLNWLYLTLEEKRKDSENKIEIIEKMAPSELKYELHNHQCKLANYASQWQTKVSEAQKFVKTREIMTTEN